MARRWIGLGLLGAVILGSLLYTAIGGVEGLRRAAPERLAPVSLTIYFGGEKARFLRNETVRSILRDDFAIALDARQAGSVEMATSLPTDGIDCLWPSNEVAVAFARESGKPVQSDRNIFNSPIVFYAWAEVAEALEAKGVAGRRDDGRYAVDVTKLAERLAAGARWREDFELEIYGPMRVFSTDPTKSNSGNIWSALLATAMNAGETPTADAAVSLAPQVAAYFRAMGFMEDSSGDIFENFLKQGVGARPIIVGYENQLVEFLVENAALSEMIRDRIRVLYPEPTIYASHPLIFLNSGCARLADALSDRRVQDVAWSEHGFRTGLIGVQNDPAALQVADLPERVGLVAPMPSAAAMRQLLDALR